MIVTLIEWNTRFRIQIKVQTLWTDTRRHFYTIATLGVSVVFDNEAVGAFVVFIASSVSRRLSNALF